MATGFVVDKDHFKEYSVYNTKLQVQTQTCRPHCHFSCYIAFGRLLAPRRKRQRGGGLTVQKLLKSLNLPDFHKTAQFSKTEQHHKLKF
jgi:hypothetical protein